MRRLQSARLLRLLLPCWRRVGGLQPLLRLLDEIKNGLRQQRVGVLGTAVGLLLQLLQLLQLGHSRLDGVIRHGNCVA